MPTWELLLQHAAAYRERAEELRTIAEGMKHGRTRDDLLHEAGSYEWMAEEQEKKAQRLKDRGNKQ